MRADRDRQPIVFRRPEAARKTIAARKYSEFIQACFRGQPPAEIESIRAQIHSEHIDVLQAMMSIDHRVVLTALLHVVLAAEARGDLSPEMDAAVKRFKARDDRVRGYRLPGD